MKEEYKTRFVVDLPVGYIQALDRYLQKIGVSRTEFMRMNIEIIHHLEIELYREDSLWDRITESQLRILEIQAKRKTAQLALIQEAFGDNQKPDMKGIKSATEEVGKKFRKPSHISPHTPLHTPPHTSGKKR